MSSKKRKYSEVYLKFGFTFTLNNALVNPVCVLCQKTREMLRWKQIFSLDIWRKLIRNSKTLTFSSIEIHWGTMLRQRWDASPRHQCFTEGIFWSFPHDSQEKESSYHWGRPCTSGCKSISKLWFWTWTSNKTNSISLCNNTVQTKNRRNVWMFCSKWLVRKMGLQFNLMIPQM